MLVNYQATLGASAVAVATCDGNDRWKPGGIPVVAQNLSGVNIWVGGPSVATSNGILVAPSQNASLTLMPGESMYAIAAAAADFRVMLGGVI